MNWTLEEAAAYYRRQGAPGDQTALVELLRETQRELGSGIPAWAVAELAQLFGVKETYLLAVIRRIPSLHLADTHCLELCGGPNCSRRKDLAGFVEKTYGRNPAGFTVRYTGCMRQCGKGPNLKWDGTLYHQADEALIRQLVEGVSPDRKEGKKN